MQYTFGSCSHAPAEPSSCATIYIASVYLSDTSTYFLCQHLPSPEHLRPYFTPTFISYIIAIHLIFPVECYLPFHHQRHPSKGVNISQPSYRRPFEILQWNFDATPRSSPCPIFPVHPQFRCQRQCVLHLICLRGIKVTLGCSRVLGILLQIAQITSRKTKLRRIGHATRCACSLVPHKFSLNQVFYLQRPLLQDLHLTPCYRGR